MIKLSELLELYDTTAECHRIAVREAKRLEDVEENYNRLLADGLRPPVKKTPVPVKPLKWSHNGGRVYAVIRDSDNACLSTHDSQRIAEKHAEGHNFPTSIVRVMEPLANGDCPTEYVANNSTWQPPPGTEWAIVRSGKTTERWRTRYATSTPWAVSPFYDYAARFRTREEAENYIEGHGLTDCQPWPVPAS